MIVDNPGFDRILKIQSFWEKDTIACINKLQSSIDVLVKLIRSTIWKFHD